MMPPSREIDFDVASAVSQGRRDYQEDAVVADFPIGSELGFAVLADGMGGHSAGDVASKIVVTEVYSELKIQSGDSKDFEANVTDILIDAVLSANECVKGHVLSNPETKGMGTTLVAPVFIRNQLFWISVGDSPLFLYREGVLKQLNEDHSMAPQIDQMVNSGQMEIEEARNHPDRNCLTSVLIGDDIARIDCPEESIELLKGDLLIVASDGLQFLSNEQIEGVLARHSKKSSSEIADILLSQIDQLGDPDQDNVSFAVIRPHISIRETVEKQPSSTANVDEEIHFKSSRIDDKQPIAARASGIWPLQFLRKSSASKDRTI